MSLRGLAREGLLRCGGGRAWARAIGGRTSRTSIWSHMARSARAMLGLAPARSSVAELRVGWPPRSAPRAGASRRSPSASRLARTASRDELAPAGARGVVLRLAPDDRPAEDEVRDALGMRGREHQGHRAALGEPEDGRLFRAGGVHDGEHVFDALLQRLQALAAGRRARCRACRRGSAARTRRAARRSARSPAPSRRPRRSRRSRARRRGRAAPRRRPGRRCCRRRRTSRSG